MSIVVPVLLWVFHFNCWKDEHDPHKPTEVKPDVGLDVFSVRDLQRLIYVIDAENPRQDVLEKAVSVVEPRLEHLDLSHHPQVKVFVH